MLWRTKEGIEIKNTSIALVLVAKQLVEIVSRPCFIFQFLCSFHVGIGFLWKFLRNGFSIKGDVYTPIWPPLNKLPRRLQLHAHSHVANGSNGSWREERESGAGDSQNPKNPKHKFCLKTTGTALLKDLLPRMREISATGGDKIWNSFLLSLWSYLAVQLKVYQFTGKQ